MSLPVAVSPAERAEPLEPWSDLKIALVHDWLTGMRGGEKVLEAVCRLLPSAPIFTLVHARGRVSQTIESHPIHVSAARWLPQATHRYRQYLPLFPMLVETFDLDTFDVVISTSHCAAKSVVRTGRARHLCYCHSPMRYGWDQFEAYFGEARVGRASGAYRHLLACLARWDRDTAGRVDRYVANSQHVAGRIRRYYNRRAAVVHPPVDLQMFTLRPGPPDRYFLVVSALVPYKRLDLAIQAAALAGVPLHIVGSGPDEGRLRALAGPNTTFLGALDDDRLREEYQMARALVLPGEEDFGIAPVESLACGRPVIALARGGAAESVTHGATGLLVEDATPPAFAAAMRGLDAFDFDPAALRASAERFSPERFETAFQVELASLLSDATRAETL